MSNYVKPIETIYKKNYIITENECALLLLLI